MASPITADSVRLAYNLLLDREPESEEAVAFVVGRVTTVGELIAYFKGSAEYREKHPAFDQRLLDDYWSSRAPVDVDVGAATFDRLVRRTREQWSALGAEDPYWSVLTHDEYRADRLDQDILEKFYETGAESARLIDVFAERTGVTVPSGMCLELGCGVGRITRFLASRFERVIAVDISAGNLAICATYLAKQQITNVETRLIHAPSDLEDLGPIDVFFSLIVLQHNAPPIQKSILDIILSKLTRNGLFLFQTPDRLHDYAFREADIDQASESQMDMHCLPKASVLKILADGDAQVRDVAMDMWTGVFGSYTYFGVKR